MEQKLFNKNFTMLVIGQIVSLFGNCALRFAIPLYLLNQTGSSKIFGTVTALAFIPTILLSPVGGILADRLNKRNIMVLLDLLTALVTIIFCIALGEVNLIVLITITLMLLYGIAGAYQPTDQASIPFLVSEENIMPANSVLNCVSSLSALIGPAVGGILYSSYGLKPILVVCAICFFLAAIMEMFIDIPYVKHEKKSSAGSIVKQDFSESIRFIRKDKPVIGKVLIITCLINMFFSAMIIVAQPVLITEVLELSSFDAEKLYGYSQAALAAGGLAGGIISGVLSQKLSMNKSGKLLLISSLCIFPIGLSLLLVNSAIVNYLVISICCFVLMILATMFTIQMMSFIQTQTPQQLIGKVISVSLTISMCAQPLGNAMYGILFDVCKGFEYVVILFAGIISLLISLKSIKIFKDMR